MTDIFNEGRVSSEHAAKKSETKSQPLSIWLGEKSLTLVPTQQAKRSVRTADTKPKLSSLHSSRPGDEQKEFDSFVIIVCRQKNPI